MIILSNCSPILRNGVSIQARFSRKAHRGFNYVGEVANKVGNGSDRSGQYKERNNQRFKSLTAIKHHYANHAEQLKNNV